ncbi:MAG: LuxR family transcriptional regulator, partial [Smithellaceae bacterium]
MLSKPKKTNTTAKGRKVAKSQAVVSRVKLRERVKELTCLYGIAQIASNPDLSLENKLADIVCLLPAAWQYSGRACARIVIDGKIFPTPG